MHKGFSWGNRTPLNHEPGTHKSLRLKDYYSNSKRKQFHSDIATQLVTRCHRSSWGRLATKQGNWHQEGLNPYPWGSCLQRESSGHEFEVRVTRMWRFSGEARCRVDVTENENPVRVLVTGAAGDFLFHA
ncbi:unnamed protein product [Sphenostylis stenocarpa]|uniref:Uncharacterized protein n=1 Tax=Sphenostylis stenocarpa TaxID=92480 RepID=A0AA86S9P5_9FABA|nr:unnamed protein product [Sphenostylis stenocarpa]